MKRRWFGGGIALAILLAMLVAGRPDSVMAQALLDAFNRANGGVGSKPASIYRIRIEWIIDLLECIPYCEPVRQC
jgi:hypothetical protein